MSFTGYCYTSLHGLASDGQAEHHYQGSVKSFAGTLHYQKLLYNIPSCSPEYQLRQN